MKYLIFILTSIISHASFAQENSEKTFDFWVGEWNARWQNPDSTYTYGTNSIIKILDETVIEENFFSPSQKYKGKSLSVYNPTKKTWHQAYTDNQGAYYDFIGLFEPGRKIFSTDTSKNAIQRMVFYKIENDSFTWDWEFSKDNGKTYQLSWRIFYTRKD